MNPLSPEHLPVELLASCRCACGELPQWDAGRKQLFWTDIPGHKLFRWHQETQAWETFWSGKLVGGITLQDDDSLLLFGDGEIFRLNRDNEAEVLIRDFDPLTGRVNETIADPEGRVFFGTVSRDGNRDGGLYRLDHDGAISKLAGDTGCANGMAFSPDARLFYWADSSARTVWAFDYNQQSGDLTHQRPCLQIAEADGIPDGLTVDAEGCLWVAFFNGGCVRRYSSQGELLLTLPLPTPRITSCTFGGDAFRDLFVTSGGGEPAQPGDDEPSPHGAVFRVKGAGQGLPEFRSHILLGER